MKTSTIQLAGTGLKTHSIKKKAKKKRPKESEAVKPKKNLVSKEEKKAKKAKKKEKQRAEEEQKQLVPASDKPPLSKSDRLKMKKIQKRLKGLTSNFKSSVPRIHRLISEEDLPNAMALTSRAFLITLTELIPIMENAVREKPGQSSVYALNALVSQVREIQADIKADNDQGQLADRICQEILFYAFQSMGQHMATSLYHLREQLRPLVKEGGMATFDALYNKAMVDLGSFMNLQRDGMREKIFAMMTLE